MSDVQVNIIKSIIFAMGEREKAKKTQSSLSKSNDHLALIISSTDYYIRSHLWLLQSGNDLVQGEISI
ncbi:MAG: hypothetical protein ACFE9L_16155 [Candidatus Hodarchaeota archaeon]